MPVAPNYALELSICDYLDGQLTASGSLLSGSQATMFTGIGNVDIASGSIVVVDASDMVEIAPYTRNYTFNVNVIVKEIAAEINSLGTLAYAVYNEFVDNDTARRNFTNPDFNISVINVREARMRPSVSGDALINEITVTMEAALIPS
jgi:hypothetical protein